MIAENVVREIAMLLDEGRVQEAKAIAQAAMVELVDRQRRDREHAEIESRFAQILGGQP